MNKVELVAKVAEVAELTKKDAQKAVEAVLTAIETGIVEDGEVSLTGYLKFTVKETAERQGHNPATGEKITIPAGKKVSVKVGSKLKELVK